MSADSSESEALLERAETFRAAFERSGQLPLLGRATSLALRAVRVATGETARGWALASYAANLHWYMHLTNRRGFLEVAHRRYTQANELLVEDPVAQAVVLGNLLQLARQQFERTGQVAVLIDAIARAEGYLNRAAGDPQRRSMIRFQCGVLWRFRFLAEDEVSNLDQAITLLRRAYRDNTDSRYVAAIANALAAALADRYFYSRVRAWLDEAVTMLRAAEESLAGGDPDRAMLANNLANFHSERFEDGGEPADLRDAVRWARTAVQAGAGGVDETRYRRTLGTFLVLKFRVAGVLGDLRDAVAELERALALAPAESDAAAMALGSLATAYDLIGRTTGSVDDRNRSLEVSREAVARTSLTSTSYRVRLNNLCNGLANEALARGEPALIDEAISRHDAMLASLPTDYGGIAELRLGAASLLVDRSRITGTQANAVAAARICAEVAATAAPGGPLLAQACVLRARALTQWRHLAPDRAVETAMRAAWRKATTVCSAASPRLGFDCAIQWLRHASLLRHWADGVDAAQAAVAALDTLVSSQRTRTEQQDWLRLGTDLAPLAAEAALGCQRPGFAAELAHRAHARLLALATDRRPDRATESEWHEAVLACSAAEPVVLVAPGQWSGAAIVISGAGGVRRVTSLTLPNLTIDAVEDQAKRLHRRTPAGRWGDGATKDLHAGLQRYGLWAGQHIFQPLLNRLPITAFSLVTLGTLGGLPHAAAWWFDHRRGAPIALRQAALVRLLPRVSSRYATADTWPAGRISRSITLAGPGDPASSADLTRAEARLLRTWTDNRTERLTENGLLGAAEADWSDVDILHAAGHSTVDLMGGGTLTPPGGPTLSLSRIRRILEQRLPAPPQLVLWSSCRTALRDARLPGEHLGLSGISLELNCTRVVATSLPVPDASAFLFTTRFLRQLLSGTPAAQAWQLAVGWLADSTAEDILSWLGEIRDAIESDSDIEVSWLLDWLRAQRSGSQPFASPVYWAQLCYIGAP